VYPVAPDYLYCPAVPGDDGTHVVEIFAVSAIGMADQATEDLVEADAAEGCIRGGAQPPARRGRHQARAGSLVVVTASNIRHLTDVSA
jgi:hypothetical protein